MPIFTIHCVVLISFLLFISIIIVIIFIHGLYNDSLALIQFICFYNFVFCFFFIYITKRRERKQTIIEKEICLRQKLSVECLMEKNFVFVMWQVVIKGIEFCCHFWALGRSLQINQISWCFDKNLRSWMHRKASKFIIFRGGIRRSAWSNYKCLGQNCKKQ